MRRFVAPRNSHKSNETILLGPLYFCVVLRRVWNFSLRHDPTRNASSNISLADVRHHELLNPSCSILDKARIRFSIRVFRILSTSFANRASKDCQYQIMKPVKRCFQISVSGFLVKQFIWAQYLVHNTETLTAVLVRNKVKYRRPSEKSPLKTAPICKADAQAKCSE